MNGSAASGRPRRRGSAIAAIACLVLLAAACGGGASTRPDDPAHPGGATTSSSAVAYSACMRSHGVPKFPDPDSDGQLPKGDAQRFGVSGSRLRTAREACQRLLPNKGAAINSASIQRCMLADDCPQALVQHVLSEEREFAGCMRSHGVPNWPDPSIDSQGRPVFIISISKDGFDPYSQQIWAKGNACSHLMPGLPGLPAAVSP